MTLNGNVDIGFTTTLEHTFINGKSYKYSTSGRVQIQASSHVVTRCGVLKKDDPPAQFRITASSQPNGMHCPNSRRAGYMDITPEAFEEACGMPILDWVGGNWDL